MLIVTVMMIMIRKIGKLNNDIDNWSITQGWLRELDYLEYDHDDNGDDNSKHDWMVVYECVVLFACVFLCLLIRLLLYLFAWLHDFSSASWFACIFPLVIRFFACLFVRFLAPSPVGLHLRSTTQEPPKAHVAQTLCFYPPPKLIRTPENPGGRTMVRLYIFAVSSNIDHYYQWFHNSQGYNDTMIISFHSL